MTEHIDRRADATRQQILRAAARQFARRSYSRVSLDDILADAEVTKGAMYFHFRSKHALAAEIVEYRAAVAGKSMNDVAARGLSGIETLIDSYFLIAVEDIGDDFGRAGLNLLEAVGRADDLQVRMVGDWVRAFADIVSRAVTEGDVITGSDPEDIARALVSLYLGARQTSSLDDPKRFLADLERGWALLLPGFANPDRIGYLDKFIKRRAAVAAKRATPLGPDTL